ncbi:hypothetical protein [Nocardia farcinica]|uniref:hypothetical protein n=1 Tax=Nocardia farcinica TaxID=37329 RepID=UPI0024587BBA|nr:hypothetical protein [Nocardia farcinica]
MGRPRRPTAAREAPGDPTAGHATDSNATAGDATAGDATDSNATAGDATAGDVQPVAEQGD